VLEDHADLPVEEPHTIIGTKDTTGNSHREGIAITIESRENAKSREGEKA
jgi:hypothetical protein